MLPSVSSIAGTLSSSEMSSFKFSRGYFFCKSSSRSRMENLVLLFPPVCGIVTSEVDAGLLRAPSNGFTDVPVFASFLLRSVKLSGSRFIMS